jgi:phenylalanyl-tRNA synthetase beta chain
LDGSEGERSMPVVTLEMDRFARLVGADRGRIMDRLPYVGLDIESESKESVRVEYSPNRPDFGTDIGIAKALRGLLGIEIGMPRYPLSSSKITVTVDRALSKVRPYVACATASGLHLDDGGIKQLISLQEDLHNGLGRRRKKVAIGIHDMTPLTPPISYKAVPPSFKLVPLEVGHEMPLSNVLTDTATGREFAWILEGAEKYPILEDSKGLAFSFPPITNANATRVTNKTRNLFIDVTSTDMKAGDDVLAIVATTLADMGGSIGSVAVDYARSRRRTPDLHVSRIRLDAGLVRRVTGLELAKRQMVECIRKSRLDVRGNSVLVPRYRIDIIHPVDIAEEVALGYGMDKIVPEYPASKQPGEFNGLNQFMDKAADVMVGAGMIELMTYELTDAKSLYTNFGRSGTGSISVEGPKSVEHSLLRDSVIPSLMAAMSGNVKEEYPQRIFEIGRVYERAPAGIEEAWHLACLVASAQASFTEAKMFLDSFLRTMLGQASRTEPTSNWAFAPGRAAKAFIYGQEIGAVGELTPESLAAFGVNVPVCGFEIDLSQLAKQLK